MVGWGEGEPGLARVLGWVQWKQCGCGAKSGLGVSCICIGRFCVCVVCLCLCETFPTLKRRSWRVQKLWSRESWPWSLPSPGVFVASFYRGGGVCWGGGTPFLKAHD